VDSGKARLSWIILFSRHFLFIFILPLFSEKRREVFFFSFLSCASAHVVNDVIRGGEGGRSLGVVQDFLFFLVFLLQKGTCNGVF